MSEQNNGSEEEVTSIAHQLWEDEGRPEGKAEEHWRRAQEQIRGRSSESSGSEASVDEPASL